MKYFTDNTAIKRGNSWTTVGVENAKIFWSGVLIVGLPLLILGYIYYKAFFK